MVDGLNVGNEHQPAPRTPPSFPSHTYIRSGLTAAVERGAGPTTNAVAPVASHAQARAAAATAPAAAVAATRILASACRLDWTGVG